MAELLEARTRQVTDKMKEKVRKRGQEEFPSYLWVVKRMVMPQNKMVSRGLDIFIADTLFFRKGEPRELISTKEIDDPELRALFHDKISATLVIKLFAERRKKYREMINAALGRKS
jgi:hypothetical protein